MNYQLLEILKCPLTKKALRFELISEFDRTYNNTITKEIKEGILFSESGFIFPVIDGIPRMLIEAHIDYAEWFSKNLKNYYSVKNELSLKYPGLIRHCVSKNFKTKQSFAFEWGLLDYEKEDKIWHIDEPGLEDLFFRESEENITSLTGKTIIDVGCGHGMNARAISKFCDFVVGAELGKSIENAYKNNTCQNVWFVQADLQFLPFANHTFDILLSGGVLHHTQNTELSFCNVETTIKAGGKLCIWLYHPQKNIIHNILNNLRKLTSHWPIKFQFIMYLLFIFPLTYTIKKIKGKKLNWREEMIDLLDTLSPVYRHEHEHDEAASWLTKRNYGDIKITIKDQYGFSIIGIKK
jgi:2-polyprenyl-3-methyl-5-hydroxy-6-metoxy-1,4-benzoquinol methylase/uncharacterized protein YbaR (Trm112 family)